MQIKCLPRNVYRLYARTQECLDAYRKEIEESVHHWEILRPEGVSIAKCVALTGISRATYYRAALAYPSLRTAFCRLRLHYLPHFASISLSWQTKNATSVQLYPDTGQTGKLPLSTAAFAITPDRSTTYRLIAVYDPNEAGGGSITAPKAHLREVAQKVEPLKTRNEKSLKVKMRDDPQVEVFLDTMETDQPTVHTLRVPAAQVATGIAGFSYHFHNSETHNLKKLKVKIEDQMLSGDGRTLTITPMILLNDDIPLLLQNPKFFVRYDAEVV